MKKRLIVNMNISPSELSWSGEDMVKRVVSWDVKGADMILLSEDFSQSGQASGHEAFLAALLEAHEACDIPIIIRGRINHFDDVKKYLYSGASGICLSEGDKISNKKDAPTSIEKIRKETVKRFGKESVYSFDKEILIDADGSEIAIRFSGKPEALNEDEYKNLLLEGLNSPHVNGYLIDAVYPIDCLAVKETLISQGQETDSLLPSVTWEHIKTNSDHLLPVILQDYLTDDVLMMAYMNEAAFKATILSKKMHYYSRSRQTQWFKGETSGHYQYVKQMYLDCDNDTLLVKIRQIGASCHTGHKTCFFNQLTGVKQKDKSALTVLEDVYGVIKERKLHPKEGSYTNYLFDSGLDKILKKVGEEAVETIIAAKEDDKHEVVYEISDFLYHMMVLMAEKEITWYEVMKELANR